MVAPIRFSSLEGLISSKEEFVYNNAEYLSKITPELIGQQDFILMQNPTKSQLEMVESFGKKSLIMLMGNFGDPAPQLPNLPPTTIIKILMEGPLMIDQVVTVLPDPVVNTSLYLPRAAAAENPAEKMRFLTSMAMKMKCSLAATMTLENSHELINLAEMQRKAALCFVSEKVAKHFLSNCEGFEEISVVGDETLRKIVNSVIGPPRKKKKGQS